MKMATIIIDNSSYVVPREDDHYEVTPGMFITQDLCSDTMIWEVIKATAKTITVRRTKDGEVVHREDRDGSGWPQVYTEVLPDPDGTVRTLRERKGPRGKGGHYSFDRDGRRGTYPAREIDGRPVSLIDYRY